MVTQRVLALVALSIAAPVLLVLYLVSTATRSGPFLFTQWRVGRAGRRFRIFKLRTMRESRDPQTLMGTAASDPLVTPLGRILRVTKLDELPQLWNVLRGDMVLVGPRPLPVELEVKLGQRLPGFLERRAVTPGVTGLAQLHDQDLVIDRDVFEDWRARSKVELDYAARRSVAGDLGVLMRTAGFLIGRAIAPQRQKTSGRSRRGARVILGGDRCGRLLEAS